MTDRRKCRMKRNGKESATKDSEVGGMVRKAHIYTDEEKEFFKEFVPGHSYREIRDAFEERFGWQISIEQVKSSVNRYGLNTGRTGYFVKGQQAHNKGKKVPADVYEKYKHTMFKKGHIPANYRPVGSERVDVDGYVEIKVQDPNKWRLKHNVVWERHHGKIPAKHVVIFLNGNKLDTDISNLKLIKRSELLILNQNHLRSEDARITEAAVNLAGLIEKTKAVIREQREREKNGQ